VLVKSSNAQCPNKICSTYLNLSIFIADATLSLRSSWVSANSSWQQASEWNLIIVAELVQREGPDLQPLDNTNFTHFHAGFFLPYNTAKSVRLPCHKNRSRSRFLYIHAMTHYKDITNKHRPCGWTRYTVHNMIRDNEFLCNRETYIYDLPWISTPIYSVRFSTWDQGWIPGHCAQSSVPFHWPEQPA
jgi:hypothetical protein